MKSQKAAKIVFTMNDAPFTEYIIAETAKLHPLHAKKLKNNFKTGIIDSKEAESFFHSLNDYLQSKGRNLDFAVTCYNKMLIDMLYYRQHFLKNGVYANSSLNEVNQKVYANTDVMEYHMQGLLLAQFLWPDQYFRFNFFRNELHNFTRHVSSYLEIGAGHGLYVQEALRQIKDLKTVDVLDISETSLNLCKDLVKNDRIRFIKEDFLALETPALYDFISIAEVVEHLESPDEALQKIYTLLNNNGIVFISTPVNSPMIDHIYLFRSIEDIKTTIKQNGFEIIKDVFKSSEPYSYEESLVRKVPIMYAAFIKKASY